MDAMEDTVTKFIQIENRNIEIDETIENRSEKEETVLHLASFCKSFEPAAFTLQL